LIDACRRGNKKIDEFDDSCFSGKYITGDISKDYLSDLDELRNDAAKEKQALLEDLTDLTKNNDF